MQSLVSIIIPNYNHAAYLKQRIESVLAQTYKHYEIILLDDCSSDNSKEIIESYRNHPAVTKIIYNDTNSGSTFRQWALGLQHAKGEWIWIAESDDLCDADFLEVMLKDAERDGCEFRACASYPINEKGALIYKRKLPDFPTGFFNGFDFIKNHLLIQNKFPNASAIVFKKGLLEEVLDHDTFHYRMVGDYWIYIKSLLKTNLYFLGDVKNYRREHAVTVRHRLSSKASYFSEFHLLRKKLIDLFQDAPNEHHDELLKINQLALGQEQGQYAMELIKNKQYFKSLKPLKDASLIPRPTAHYLKSALYWILKGNSVLQKQQQKNGL